MLRQGHYEYFRVSGPSTNTRLVLPRGLESIQAGGLGLGGHCAVEKLVCSHFERNAFSVFLFSKT